MRRKSYDVHTAPRYSLQKLCIGKPYAIEERILSSPLDLCCAPWFGGATLQRFSGRSDIVGLIWYALSRWEALSRYLDDGTLTIDNNAVERAIGPLALSRK